MRAVDTLRETRGPIRSPLHCRHIFKAPYMSLHAISSLIKRKRSTRLKLEARLPENLTAKHEAQNGVCKMCGASPASRGRAHWLC